MRTLARCVRAKTSARPAVLPVRSAAWLWGAVIGVWLSVGVWSVSPPSTAHAWARDDGTDAHLVVPPPPKLAPPRLTLGLHTGISAPLNHESLCPAGLGCVLRTGGGVGGSLEQRWPSGFGVAVAYELFFFDTDSVYELGVQQILHAGLRYTMPTDVIFHPMFAITGGAHVYGDTFAVATGGVLCQIMAGADIELTATFALQIGVGLRIFSHRAFRTRRDDVLRGDGGKFSESFLFEVGLLFQ